MTRFWRYGEPIHVEAADDGHPITFRWAGVTHQVEGITRRWRVDEAWWILRIWREYFKLYTDTGLLVVIYHDLLTGQWNLQRLYD